jgi:hypothetical protein
VKNGFFPIAAKAEKWWLYPCLKRRGPIRLMNLMLIINAQALYLVPCCFIVRPFYIQLMFILLYFEPINGQLQLYPSLPGVEGARALAREARRADSRRPEKESLHGFESASITAWIS